MRPLRLTLVLPAAVLLAHASGCSQALGLDGYEVLAEGECPDESAGCGGAGGAGGQGGQGSDQLCRDLAGRALVCGRSPRAPERACGQCGGGETCAPDQRACLRPGQTYCGDGVVCGPGQLCASGGCVGTTCSGLGLVCGSNPLTGEPCGQCASGTTCTPNQRSCQGPSAACAASGLACGFDPGTGEPCGQCGSGETCTPDQRACLGPTEAYCGGGVVCGSPRVCFNGACQEAAAVCAAFGRVCGEENQSGALCGDCPGGQKCAETGKKCVPAATKICSNGTECSVLKACPSMSAEGLCQPFCEGRPLRCGVVVDPIDTSQIIDCGDCAAGETCQVAAFADGTKGCAPAGSDYCGADVVCPQGRCLQEDGQGPITCQ